MHAWKVLIPPERKRPQLKSHDGYEWLYVLSGELRSLLGGHDLSMNAGEVAEFDPGTPLVRRSRRSTRRGPQPPQPAERAHIGAAPLRTHARRQRLTKRVSRTDRREGARIGSSGAVLHGEGLPGHEVR